MQRTGVLRGEKQVVRVDTYSLFSTLQSGSSYATEIVGEATNAERWTYNP